MPSLGNRGAMILVKDLNEACEISNYISPEHLELSVENPQEWAKKSAILGAIFMGRYTGESLGDYCVEIRTMCCPPAEPPAFPRLWGHMISKNAPA